MNKFFQLLTIALCLSTAIFITGCTQQPAKPASQQTPVTIRIAYLPITHALPLFATAELQSPDSPVRVELIKYGSWPELMDALNTGKVDGASVLIELAVKAKEQGIDLKAAALGHKDGNVIITANTIEQASDLKNTIFAIPHKQSSHKLLLDQWLADHNMSENDLKIVELSPPEMPAALAQKQISGYCVAEPFGAKSVVLKTGKVFAHSDEIWPESICCALVFNNDFLKNNRDAAKKILQSYQQAGDHLTNHPDAAIQIAKKYLKANDAILDLSMQWISYQDLRIQEPAYNELIHRMLAAKLIQHPPAYIDFIDNSLLNEI